MLLMSWKIWLNVSNILHSGGILTYTVSSKDQRSKDLITNQATMLCNLVLLLLYILQVNVTICGKTKFLLEVCTTGVELLRLWFHPRVFFNRWPSAGANAKINLKWTMRSWVAAFATITTKTSSTKQRENAMSTDLSVTCRACWERQHKRS